MLIRPATPADLPGIAAIYDPQCITSVATFMTEPRTPTEWADWLREHHAPRHPAVVAVEHNLVLGWASLSPWSPRPAYDRTAESSVYVAHNAQGRGIGRSLMLDVMSRGRATGVAVVIARCVEQNPGAVTFHERLGFGTIGVQRRAGEKLARLLDVRIMDKHLDLP